MQVLSKFKYSVNLLSLNISESYTCIILSWGSSLDNQLLLSNLCAYVLKINYLFMFST